MPQDTWQVRAEAAAASSPWHWTDLRLILLLLIAAQLVRHFLSADFGWDILAFHGAIAAGLLYTMRGKSAPFGHSPAWHRAIPEGLFRWLLVLPPAWVAALLWQMLLRMMNIEPAPQLAVELFLESGSLAHRIAFFVFAAGIAPVVEEGLFRGVLQPLLVRRFGPLPGILLLAALFALVHGSLTAMATLTVISIALSLAAARTGGLRVPILMHMAFNAGNLLALMLFDQTGLI